MRIRKKFEAALRRPDGVITVEAAVTLPFVLLFVLAWIACIHLLIIQMAVQSAVSETVKTVAAQMALSNAAQDAVRHIAPEQAEHIAQMVSAMARMAAPELYRGLLRRLANERLLDVDRIRIVHARLPSTGDDLPFDLQTAGDMAALTVEYPVTLRLPFYSKKVVLRASAAERAWF
jgi:hypothetical protein